MPSPTVLPNRVTIELTNACNLNCVMCPRHFMMGAIGRMSWELYRKIIDEIANYPGVAMIPFFRGESMLHPEFVRMLVYARKRGVSPIQLATNATRMTAEIARAIVDLEIEFVSFSVDAIDQETYATIRRGGDLKQVLENIEYFCDYKRGKGQDKPEVQISLVRTEHNASEISRFVDHWRQRVNRVRIFEQHSSDGHFGSLVSERHVPVFDKRLPCLKVFNEIAVYWNGQVALCCNDWDRKRIIGDLNKDTIADVWMNDTYKNIRETHLTDYSNMEDLCKNCDQWKAYYLPQGVGSIGELYTSEMETIYQA